MSKTARKDWIHWIETIEKHGRGLSEWEQGFVEDMRYKLEEDGERCFSLTRAQAEKLEQIYAERTPN